jgi:hypothetical protein
MMATSALDLDPRRPESLLHGSAMYHGAQRAAKMGNVAIISDRETLRAASGLVSRG